jgi:ABC-type Na+ efflux pump permease subunit
VPLSTNTGHELNIPVQQPQQTSYAAAQNMEGQEGDTTDRGMPQPFDAPTDKNNGQSQDKTAQGTSEPDDVPDPPLSPSCMCILFNHSCSNFL